MRPKHLKFHAAAILVISILIVVLYVLFGPRAPGPVEETVGDRFITIDNATWGKNCDPFVDQARAKWRVPEAGAAPSAPPTRATHNNVLQTLRTQCDGKLSCRLVAMTETFGVDPLPSCFKRLTVGYRCFAYDRLQSVEVGQGDLLSLDCRERANAQ